MRESPARLVCLFLFPAGSSQPRPWVAWKQDLNSCQTVNPKGQRLFVFSEFHMHNSERILGTSVRGACKMFGTRLTWQLKHQAFTCHRVALERLGEAVHWGTQRPLCLFSTCPHPTSEVLSPEDPLLTLGDLGKLPLWTQLALASSFVQLPAGRKQPPIQGLAKSAKPSLPRFRGQSVRERPSRSRARRLCGTSCSRQKVPGWSWWG